MINVSAVKLVAGREVTQQVRGKALWISTLITMIAIALLVILPTVLSSGPATYRIAVAGPASASTTSAIEAAVRGAGARAFAC